MNMNGVDPKVMPARLGLPIDPVLQMWAGSMSATNIVVLDGTGRGQIAIANSMRVAIYVLPWVTTGPWFISPDQVLIAPTASMVFDARPLLLHCRDYPGLVQSALFVAGQPADKVIAWEYVLQPQWR